MTAMNSKPKTCSTTITLTLDAFYSQQNRKEKIEYEKLTTIQI